MESFLKLATVFYEMNERNFEYLSSCYSHINKLEKLIFILTSETFEKVDLKNKKILLKPNWVNHDRNQNDSICLRTNNSFILAVLKVVLAFNPKIIIIGDAPIQGCSWDKILNPDFISKVKALSKTYSIPVVLKDFRNVKFDTIQNRIIKELNPPSNYIFFDVGEQSFLEPITHRKKKQFRVDQYDYIKLSEKHKEKTHKYCIARDLFDVDIVISLPKVKTHQKAGITAALKNLVGVNGDKDYLPHHRIGGTKLKGDSYLGLNLLKEFAERLLDISNKMIGSTGYPFLRRLAVNIWKLSGSKKIHKFGAGWYGNDTTWRMVLDINKIILYGKVDGTFSDIPQRQLFSLCDGIIAGQGNGPLFPHPLELGFISFTNNSAINDYVFARLMDFEPEKLPLILNAFKIYPKLFDNISLNNKKINLSELEKLKVTATPPPGWIDYLKNQ